MKFPHTRQADSRLCGLACLCSVCKYYGYNYKVAFLSQFSHITEAGISLYNLSKTAQHLGFETMCIAIPFEKLKHCQFPAIIHWNQNHYVVLYKIDYEKGKIYVSDPAKGNLTFTIPGFLEHWNGSSDKGVVLLLEPTTQLGEVKPENERALDALSLVWDYLKIHKSSFLQVILGLFFATTVQIILPLLTQCIVDIGIGHKSIKFIWLVLVGELFLIIGKMLTDFIRRWLMLHISLKINIKLVSDFFIKLLQLPMVFFEKRTIGDLNQRINDHQRVQSFMTSQFLSSIFSFISIIALSTILFIYNKFIFCVFLVSSLLYLGWVNLFLNKRKHIDYELFDVYSEIQSKTIQLLTSIQEIKLQNCCNRRRWEWEDVQADLFSIQQKSLKLQQTQEAGSIFISEIKNIFIVVYSAMAVIDGTLTLGGMMAIQFIIGQLISPIEQLLGLIFSYQDMKISIERINDIHHTVTEKEIFGNKKILTTSPNIEFKNVSFKYNPQAPTFTLNNLSFTIPKGKITAIVGASGSGKTTLIKMILGFYKPISGSIILDSDSLDSYDMDWWREQCGVVMQEGFIFAESVAKNIAVGDNEIDQCKLEFAAKIANIHDTIMKLPLKYETIIGKQGRGLSQGQKQRILIARAIYKNPAFIFLDEATNSLDTENERVIVSNLQQFFIGKTVVIIAHRLSTVKSADNIIVLNKGHIVEAGNHQELVKRKGMYFELIKNQLDLESSHG